MQRENPLLPAPDAEMVLPGMWDIADLSGRTRSA